MFLKFDLTLETDSGDVSLGVQYSIAGVDLPFKDSISLNMLSCSVVTYEAVAVHGRSKTSLTTLIYTKWSFTATTSSHLILSQRRYLSQHPSDGPFCAEKLTRPNAAVTCTSL